MAESTTITKEDAAEKLDGCQYREEGSPELFAAMKAARLVAVFGASDDLMEFRGAIYDEVGAYDGGTAYLTPAGLLVNDCEDGECPHFARAKKAAAKIIAKWSEGGFSWRYETAIPHTKFIIGENDERYCEGIVFALKDVPPLDLSTAVEG
nr:hypothetical protein NG677_03925 [Methylobacterium sp. OTU13CASTA1]